MLDPWIIEEIRKREEEERIRREQEINQPRIPADKPSSDPDAERPGNAPPKPGYEMPNQDGGHKPDTGDRGVADVPLGEIDIPKEGS